MRLTGPHWDFALHAYARPGVAEVCLALQERDGVDVSVLLMALYASARRAVSLTRDDLAVADVAIGAWSEEIVVPLRGIRRRLKRGPPPAPNSRTEDLRTQVKEAELRAEQIELAVLADWVDTLARDRSGGGGAIVETIGTVVAHYRSRSGKQPDQSQLTAASEIDLARLERALRS